MNNFDFDKNFNRAVKFSIVAFIFNAALGLSLIGAFIWVAWHFISKFW